MFARVVSRNGNGTICWVEDYANNDKGRAKTIREHHFGILIPDERMLANIAALLIAKAQQLTTAVYLPFWIDSEESGELITRVDFGNPPDLLRICLAAHELSPSSFPRFKKLR